MILLLFSLLGTVNSATQCPCTFSIDPLAVSDLTSYVYPVFECDQICGPPALAYQYYSFEEPLGPCNCYQNETSLSGNYYANATTSINLYYQNGGLSSICDPCFPSPTSSPSPSLSVSVTTTVSPSGMCYVVSNLLYGKVYTDGYYTVVHGINASHAYNPAPIVLGRNPTCTESPGICTCAYTQGSTFSCPYTRSATLRYQYGASTTMTFVNESPVCRYTFNMFINLNSPSPTPSMSPSFTPAGSPTVSKTSSVSLSPSVSQTKTETISVTSSASPSLTTSSSASPSISESEIPIVKPFVKQQSETVISPSPVEKSNTDGVTGIVLGSITALGSLGLVGSYMLQTKSTNRENSTDENKEEETTKERIEDPDDEENIKETIEDLDDEEDYGTPKTVVLLDDDEFIQTTTVNDKDDDKKDSKALLEIDSEVVDAVMEFLQQRMKTGKVMYR